MDESQKPNLRLKKKILKTKQRPSENKSLRQFHDQHWQDWLGLGQENEDGEVNNKFHRENTGLA